MSRTAHTDGMLESPWLVPVPIPTDTAWQRFKARFATRYFCLGRDWQYLNSSGERCVIPGAFHPDGKIKEHYHVTDGKSYPRIFRPFFSALGIGLVEGLVHDFTYRYQCQIKVSGQVIKLPMTREQCDNELRQIGLQVNDMPVDSGFAYYVLRVFGDFAWSKHRSNDGKPRNDVEMLLRHYEPWRKVSEKPVKRPF